MSGMNRKVKELKAATLLEALSHAQTWMKENAPSDICWFRGIKDGSLPLMPGAYWRKDYDELDTLLEFSQEGRAFADIGEVDDWKTYYLAQHSGVPTRLLDWTENFITLDRATDVHQPIVTGMGRLDKSGAEFRTERLDAERHRGGQPKGHVKRWKVGVR